MRYVALASDYDGTLALDGQVDEPTIFALQRLRASGRRLILVSGRELEDLLRVFPQITLCDLAVLENGALLYHPASRKAQPLGPPPPAAFIAALQARGVTPLSVGRVIVATWHPNETVVLEVIRELGLELQVIFNKGAVMVLPPGINKASGLVAALRELSISPHNVVAVGDAENDHALLQLCECAVAVANALPSVKTAVDWVTQGDHGAGVRELIDRLIATDLRDLEPRLTRHHILLGEREDGTPVQLPPYGVNVLLAGPSGSGKSTVATGILERLIAQGYQICGIDPEGDYEHFAGAIVLGDRHRAPSVEEVLEVLARPDQNVVVNLLGLPLEDRPAYFNALLARLMELRTHTGRPHWIVADETHHLLPPNWAPATGMLPQDLQGLLMITVHPNQIAPAVLTTVDLVLAIGADPGATLQQFGATVGQPLPPFADHAGNALDAIAWWQRREPPFRLRVAPPAAERQRHRRKYAEGELGPDKSFYFRGPEDRLNLRAQNLQLFMQLAEGVDDATWQYHLRRGDYARWFRESIGDAELAAVAERVAAQAELPTEESRAAIRRAIEERYTRPA
ncbi:HAD-IIB family hydrolase [Kallotenue papyrolyticum]|uniref:HAD-IIB family hydrolase n=1 Tax=Kallotenue papyrolyticum TaxID=1325125 RepID=UPI0004926205|nr:HAD-IIB family hydrolase [Kallotenue papyrolyticum]